MGNDTSKPRASAATKPAPSPPQKSEKTASDQPADRSPCYYRGEQEYIYMQGLVKQLMHTAFWSPELWCKYTAIGIPPDSYVTHNQIYRLEQLCCVEKPFFAPREMAAAPKLPSTPPPTR